MADPVSVAQPNAVYEARLRELQALAMSKYQAYIQGNQARWYRPANWSGDVTDYEGIKTPFSRDTANADYVKAVSSGTTPGTVGDVIASSTVVGCLSTLERAFRLRHTMNRSRSVALVAGRLRGHGNERGPIVQCGIEYARAVLRQAKVRQ